jgi:hypothetical protein
MNISNFINNIIKYLNNVFSDFFKFMVENNLVNLFVVGIIGIALSFLIGSLKVNIFDYYLNKLFKTTNNNIINFVTSFCQFLLIIIFLYFIYNTFLKNISRTYVINKFDEIEWKNNLLNEIRNINSKIK